MRSHLSAFIHAASTSLGKLTITGLGPGTITQHKWFSWEEHKCWKKYRNCCYSFTSFLPYLWSTSITVDMEVLCELQLIKYPFIFQSHTLPSVKFQGRKIT